MTRKAALALLASLGKAADNYSLETDAYLVASLDGDVRTLESAVASAAEDGELSPDQKDFYEKKILLLKQLIAKKKGLE